MVFNETDYFIKLINLGSVNLMSGINVNQINAGKKCIGIAYPGNISGNSKSNGSLNPIGPIILAKLKIENKKLNIISPNLGSNVFSPQKPIDASVQAKILAPNKLPVVTIFEKSRYNAS